MTLPYPLRNPTEAFGKLEESKYKAELDLVDRYRAFVAELLRLSLAGIGVFGFLYQHIFSSLDSKPLAADVVTKIIWAKELSGIGVLVFSLCTACALVFRFFATEGARYYIEALRFLPGQEGLPFAADQRDRAIKSLEIRHRRIVFCQWFKGFAAFFLGLGSFLIAIAFYLLVVPT